VIRDGRASVVTGVVSTFTASGVRLSDGRPVAADVIVTATGLNVRANGGIALSVDGVAVHLPDTVAYKGTMLSGVPNFCYVFGYTNASWTLRVGLLGSHFSRMLSYMDARGYTSVVPFVSAGMRTRPLLDFESGYIKRALDAMPRQGTSGPWRTARTYWGDARLLRRPVNEPELRFSSTSALAASVSHG
jgi:monooxygenase